MSETLNRSMTTIQLLEGFGLVKSKKAPMAYGALKQSGIAFTPKNLATENIEVGPVATAIRESGVFQGVRSAHMGSRWSEIMRGGAGELSLNKAIIQDGIGQPLIFDFNQTPTPSGEGDNLYRPGIDTKTGKQLPVSTWNGQRFEPRQNDSPWFVPFCMTEVDGRRLPLTTHHRKEMKAVYPNFKFLSDKILEQEPKTKQILVGLFENCLLEDDDRERGKALGHIIDRFVTPSGKVERHDLNYNDRTGEFLLGGEAFRNAEHVADAALNLIKIASGQKNLENVGNINTVYPLMSKEFLIFIMAELNMDKMDSREPTKPFNFHTHIGAFQMAGAPPAVKGYFGETVSKANTITAMYRHASREKPENFTPLYYLLIAGAPYALWAMDVNPTDTQAVNELMSRMHDKAVPERANDTKQISAVTSVAKGWLQDYRAGLSQDYQAKFSSVEALAARGKNLVKPAGFDNLTFREMCLLISALKTA